MDRNDMIIVDNDNITCDGYTINSNFLNNGIPITCNRNNDNLFGKSIPIGLSFLNTETSSMPVNHECNVINNSTYDKFINTFTGDAKKCNHDMDEIIDNDAVEEENVEITNILEDKDEPDITNILEDKDEPDITNILEDNDDKPELVFEKEGAVLAIEKEKPESVEGKSKTRKGKRQTRVKKQKNNRTRVKKINTKKMLKL